MEIAADELDRAIKLGKQRERARCMDKVQDQIDIALGRGDMALAGALSAAKAEIELGVPAVTIFAPDATPATGRDPVRLPDMRAATEHEISNALGQYVSEEGPQPTADQAAAANARARQAREAEDGLPPVRERDDVDYGTGLALALLRQRR